MKTKDALPEYFPSQEELSYLTPDQISTLTTYIQHVADIPGWMAPPFIRFLIAVDRMQKRSGKEGAVAEFGILFGKSLILMAILNGGRHPVLGCSNFPQDSLRLTEEYLRLYAADYIVNMKLFKSRTQTLNRKEWVDAVGDGGLRLFYLDAAHDAEGIQNEFRIADECLSSSGILIVDDWFSSTTPGVAEGIIRLFFHQSCNLIPFVIWRSKVLFCRPGYHELYKDRIADEYPEKFLEKELLNTPIRVFTQHSEHPFFDSK